MSEYFIYIIAILCALNVFLGGYLVYKFKKYFNIILGFAGGIMISIISFSIIPEIIHISTETENTYIASIFFILGIGLFHTISHFFPLHEHGHHNEENEHDHKIHHHKGLGIYGAILIIIHSFIDGFGIGLGFLISTSIGISLAIAVIAHNFSDGINTVSTLIHGKYNNLKIRILFGLNILAPLLGIITSQFARNTFFTNELFLLAYLAFFAGSILYLAISDILPHAHSDKNEKKPIFATLLAVFFIFLITLFLPNH